MTLYALSICLFLSWILKISAEQIVNEADANLSCGITEDCFIICNETNSCQDSKFYVYNHAINIECSGYRSCFFVDIIASNVQSLNITVTGDEGFYIGELLSDSNTADVAINCSTENSCTFADFNLANAASTIHCASYHSCQFTDISVQHSSVTMECLGTYSCYYTQLITTNATSVALIVEGENGFDHSFFSSDIHTQQITVDCVARSACYVSTFYYHGKQPAAHNCDGWLACSSSTIYALSPIAVDCVYYSDMTCSQLEVIFPVNITNHQLSSITISDPLFSSSSWGLRIWSFYHITPTINYVDGFLNETRDKILIIYGNRFLDYCQISDTECVNNAEKIQDDNVMIWDVYSGGFQNDYDFSAYNSDNNNVLLILSDPKTVTAPFTPPIINDNGYLSILCIFCVRIWFNLQSLQNIFIAHTGDYYNALYQSKIIGPQNSFMLNTFDHASDNTYFLNHTMNITINSIYKGSVYVDNQMNLNINCEAMIGCKSSNIYSSSDPITSPSLIAAWNIVCQSSSYCSNFLFHFPVINRTCSYSSDGFENCGFLTSAPSGSPTVTSLSPTDHPSFTPTKYPSFSPLSFPSNAPSLLPTHYPSTTPTTAPTGHPSFTPTISPTTYPSFTPTMYPSVAPTNDPSIAPTISPTKYPSFSPLSFPSNAPSVLPTHYPSTTPTTFPTNYPSNSPSVNPTSFPSTMPTTAPTISPSFSPIYHPTTAPTGHPSFRPTISPTTSPTLTPIHFPTVSPTLFPTLTDSFSKSQSITYQIIGLTKPNIYNIIDKTYDDIITLTRMSYVAISDYYLDDNDNILEYKDFNIIADEKSVEQTTLTIISSVYYEHESVGRLLLYMSDKMTFIDYTKELLIQYFNNNRNLQFWVEISSTEEPVQSSPFNALLYALLVYMTLMILASIAAKLMNKKANSKIDNAEWITLFFYGLQVVDFITDLNLWIEILIQVKPEHNNNKLWLYSFIGCTVSIVIPFIVNIWITANIKNRVSGNKAATTYFEQRSLLFITLVVFSGSAYSSLALVSSRVFSLSVFDSGLTLYELRKLSKIKIIADVVLENVPQLTVQIIYSYYLGGPSQSTYLSLVFSFLSIFAALLTYLVNSKSSDIYVTQYDLEMVKDQQLSKEEKDKILNKKERKEELTKALCATLKIEDTCIELGYVKVMSDGFVMHVIHYTFKNDLYSGNSPTNNDYYEKLAKQHIYRLYNERRYEVNECFIQHFEVDDQFQINYSKQFCSVDISTPLQSDNDEEDEDQLVQQLQLNEHDINKTNETEMV